MDRFYFAGDPTETINRLARQYQPPPDYTDVPSLRMLASIAYHPTGKSAWQNTDTLLCERSCANSRAHTMPDIRSLQRKIDLREVGMLIERRDAPPDMVRHSLDPRQDNPYVFRVVWCDAEASAPLVPLILAPTDEYWFTIPKAVNWSEVLQLYQLMQLCATSSLVESEWINVVEIRRMYMDTSDNPIRTMDMPGLHSHFTVNVTERNILLNAERAAERAYQRSIQHSRRNRREGR